MISWFLKACFFKRVNLYRYGEYCDQEDCIDTLVRCHVKGCRSERREGAYPVSTPGGGGGGGGDVEDLGPDGGGAVQFESSLPVSRPVSSLRAPGDPTLAPIK